MSANEHTLVFRVDGGPIPLISFGHLFRCITVAKAIRDKVSTRIVFVCRDFSEARTLLNLARLDVQWLAQDISRHDDTNILKRFHNSTIVFDLINVENLDLTAIARNGNRIVVMDDAGGKNVYADLVINGGILASRKMYRVANPSAKYCLGIEYCVLETSLGTLSARINSEVGSILLTMGGTDAESLTVKVLAAMQRCGLLARLKWTIVAGPGNSKLAEIERVATQYPSNIELAINPANLHVYFEKADFAIVTAGRTAYELASIGMPLVITPSNSHENRVAAAFYRNGLALHIDQAWLLAEDRFAADLIDRIHALMPLTSRQGLAIRCKEAFDHLGLDRVVKEILALHH